MDEKELRDSYLKGDKEAFKLIVEAYTNQMMALAMNLLSNLQDAEDVCQEAFIQAFRNLNRYDSKQNFRHWLMTIVYRRSLDVIRKRKRLAKFLGNLKNRLANRNHESDTPRNSDISWFELKPEEILSPLLAGLSVKQKAIVTLWAKEGLRSEEIAAIIGCRPSTVRVQLYLARKKIKESLKEKGMERKNVKM